MAESTKDIRGVMEGNSLGGGTVLDDCRSPPSLEVIFSKKSVSFAEAKSEMFHQGPNVFFIRSVVQHGGLESV